jgi:hypothetical protein
MGKGKLAQDKSQQEEVPFFHVISLSIRPKKKILMRKVM